MMFKPSLVFAQGACYRAFKLTVGVFRVFFAREKRVLPFYFGTSAAVLSFGVALSVVANVVMNSGEAFVRVLADLSGKNFGNLKIAFDVFCVAAAVVLSILFFDFRIEGTREGTIFAALFTGLFVRVFLRWIRKPVEKRLVG